MSATAAEHLWKRARIIASAKAQGSSAGRSEGAGRLTRVLDVFAVEGLTMLIVEIGLLAVKIYAFVSSLRFSDEAYRVAGKLNKAAWTIISGWAWWPRSCWRVRLSI